MTPPCRPRELVVWEEGGNDTTLQYSEFELQYTSQKLDVSVTYRMHATQRRSRCLQNQRRSEQLWSSTDYVVKPQKKSVPVSFGVLPRWCHAFRVGKASVKAALYTRQRALAVVRLLCRDRSRDHLGESSGMGFTLPLGLLKIRHWW